MGKRIQLDKDEIENTVNKLEFDEEIEKFSKCLKDMTTRFSDDSIAEKTKALDQSVLEKLCPKEDVDIFTKRIEKRITCKFNFST